MLEELLNVVADPDDKRVPEVARACLSALGAQLRRIKEQILEFDRLIKAWHRSNEMSMRSMKLLALARCWPPLWSQPLLIQSPFDQGATSWPGLGWFLNSIKWRQEQARQISKQGDRYLRGLFVAGALAVIRYAKIHGAKHRPWLTALLARRPTKVAAIVLANKIARMVWAMMTRGERYKEPVELAA